MTKRIYTVEPVEESSRLTDVRILIEGKVWHLWGRKGDERERTLVGVSDKGAHTLPVLFGAGLGVCIEKLLERGPVAVVDNDPQIAKLTGADRFRDHPQVLWIDGKPAEVLNSLKEWQNVNGGRSFEIIKIPLYLRLDPDWYAVIANTLAEMEKTEDGFDFWEQVKYPKFQNVKPKILFLNRPYFLTGEIISALDRLGISYRTVDIGLGDTVRDGFVEDLLKSVVEFKPDFALTVNHFGIDREGKLTDLLLKLKLPLASWFVDNPHLVLYRYKDISPELTAIFTYDAGNLEIMHDKGYGNVFYLPLATDPCRFKAGIKGKNSWRAKVSFVGNSMADAVANTLLGAKLPANISNKYQQLAAEFCESADISVEEYFKKNHPQVLEAIEGFATDEQKLSFEALITWEATRQYRLSCIKELLSFNPLIVGDCGWHVLLDNKGWHYLSSLDYYTDLPAFYPMSDVSFNCTSRQMKGAVNQRIFDVPACGGFILTDYREQMENLFEPENEIISYRNVKEIPQVLERCIKDKKMRARVSAAALKRILFEHTYEHRLISLMDKMRKTFG
ncbi:CgeB family protein [Desulfovibrio gilichinskyi]|uniref:Spore maturation protein CgeB n=1 Tax=Desulfovibrio gilichinskyi TaxID=1519643 RepID=A0A1X7F0B1_9BACT|nr:glycosyltransferase [Desulfovibrio gilichinskyi]SMF42977.1 spore maturation protein CgeB [Desulfovibrio gilichinskyi]